MKSAAARIHTIYSDEDNNAERERKREREREREHRVCSKSCFLPPAGKGEFAD